MHPLSYHQQYPRRFCCSSCCGNTAVVVLRRHLFAVLLTLSLVVSFCNVVLLGTDLAPTTTTDGGNYHHPGTHTRHDNNHDNNDKHLLQQQQPQQQQPQQPTHHACDGYDGIFHIAVSDELGGVGTALIQLVLLQLDYADRYNLKPWIHFNNFTKVFYDPIVHGRGPGVNLTAMVGRKATYLAPDDPRRTATTTTITTTTTSRSRSSTSRWDSQQQQQQQKDDTFVVTQPPQPQPPSSNPYWNHRRDRVPGPPDASLPVHQATLHFPGTGVWTSYFDPVSDFVPGDESCQSKLYVTMDLYLIIPGLHGYDDRHAMRAWRYEYLPSYLRRDHIPLQEWLEPQRRRAHNVWHRYGLSEKLKPTLRDRVRQRIHPDCRQQQQQQQDKGGGAWCLGLHIRHSDKAAGRRRVPTEEFRAFAEAFVAAGGTYIYLATDSSLVWDDIRSTWPRHVVERFHQYHDQQDDQQQQDTTSSDMVRSSTGQAVFDLASHDRINQDALVEIFALGECHFLVHGLSALSEASIWMRGESLHHQSVNLEDPDHIGPSDFQQLVAMTMTNSLQKSVQLFNLLPGPPRTERWWKALEEITVAAALPKHHQQQQPLQSSNTLCDNNTFTSSYNGVLHIATVGSGGGTVGRGLLQSVLNQLLVAERYNLLPWIHLDPEACHLLYDLDVHATTGMPNNNNNKNNSPPWTYETIRQPLLDVREWQATRQMRSNNNTKAAAAAETRASTGNLPPIRGSGIWNTYFEPVSDFDPRNPPSPLCQQLSTNNNNNNKPLPVFTLGDYELNDVIDARAPWALRSWRSNGTPQDVWLASTKVRQQQYREGHRLMRKYVRFREPLLRRADRVNPLWNSSLVDTDLSSRPSTSSASNLVPHMCLGVHLRTTADKRGKFRRVVSADKYVPYLEAFGEQVERDPQQRHFAVYIASDSNKALRYLNRTVTSNVRSLFRTQGRWVVRSSPSSSDGGGGGIPPVYLDDHHRVTSETLVDLLALSKCQWLLHSSSSVPEISIYLNPGLSDWSVNLEQGTPNVPTPNEFGSMVQRKLEQTQP